MFAILVEKYEYNINEYNEYVNWRGRKWRRSETSNEQHYRVNKIQDKQYRPVKLIIYIK